MTPREFAEVVCKSGNKRSEAYKLGVAAWAARVKFGESVLDNLPYVEGTAEFDAFFHGVDRGRNALTGIAIDATNNNEVRDAWGELQKKVASPLKPQPKPLVEQLDKARARRRQSQSDRLVRRPQGKGDDFPEGAA